MQTTCGDFVNITVTRTFGRCWTAVLPSVHSESTQADEQQHLMSTTTAQHTRVSHVQIQKKVCSAHLAHGTDA